MPLKRKNRSYKIGDICLIKFHPSFGSELKKYRPAVVVSNKTNNIDHRFTLIAPLTTSTHNFNKQYELIITSKNGLEKKSVLLCWYLWTIDNNRIASRIGRLTTKEIIQMKKKVRKLLE